MHAFASALFHRSGQTNTLSVKLVTFFKVKWNEEEAEGEEDTGEGEQEEQEGKGEDGKEGRQRRKR